ncbi:MAG: hypothetical protein R3324_00060 [Halobacteriales archaeon]|nr:hypothetical protein [Halobacteriales archaeon]
MIYTENLASRGTDVGGADAIEAREAMVDGVAGLVEKENNGSYEERSHLESNVTHGIQEHGFVALRTRIKNGVVVNTSVLNYDDGVLVLQDSAGEMTDKDSEHNWFLANGTTGTRDFVLEIDESGLTDTSDPRNDSFNVRLIGSGGNRWNIYVYKDGGTTTLAVRNGSQVDPTENVCSPSTNPTINLTAGTVDGTPCSAIEYGKGVSEPYDIGYVYGNRSTGTYELTANVTTGDVQDGNLYGAASGNSPYWEPVVYAVHVDFLYETYPLTYRSQIRIVPEEPT